MADRQVLPIIFVRFEDLLTDPIPHLNDVFRFIFGQESIEGTFLEKRIIEVTMQGTKSNTVYKPRSGGINYNASKYTET